MNIGFIIQARLGSTRLPNKILLPFTKEKQCIIDIMLERLSSFKDIKTVVATSIAPINDLLVQHLTGVSVYRGSENDVLQRFIEASECFHLDGIIRICSDNPFLDINELRRLIDSVKESNADYVSFKINDTPSIKTHFGFWAEYVTLAALKKVRDRTSKPIYHEHVTNYIYTHPDEFKIKWLSTFAFLQNREDIRLTIDQEDDFKIAQLIFNKLSSLQRNCGIEDIVNVLDENPALLESMKKQIIKNSK